MIKILTNDKNNSLFDEPTKNEFLEEMIKNGSINEETSKSYLRIFGITSEFEEKLKKDLVTFELNEIEKILYSFEANNRNTVESYARIISSYLNWGVLKGKIAMNPLAKLKPNDFITYLTNDEVYFTDKQLRRYEDRCENYQDAVIIRLLFNGVSGKQMTEIRNLKKSDVFYDEQRLRLTNTLQADKDGLPLKYTERYIDVDIRTLDLIKGAINQKMYQKRNGQMDVRENIRPYTDLVENDYVLRASITKTDNRFSPVDKFVIYRRLQVIAESLGIEDLTSKFIQRSGMIHLANKTMQDEELQLDDFKIIANQFNLKSYHNLKGFITLENIRKTYPIEDSPNTEEKN